MALLDSLLSQASALGASDLHLEAGLPATLRVNGQLRPLDLQISPTELAAEAARLLDEEGWAALQERRSADLARTIGGTRCRIHVLHSAHGLGFAIRLLHPFQATLDSLNLHPELARLLQRPSGLLLVSGATGSGKSSTLAAFVEEINRSRAAHIITLEQPIEHSHRQRRSLIRQREVGRDTPTFQQGLMDALRQDPDVLVVGEVREAETIRLALTAAETGHLVITTLHAGSCAEALSRIVASFAPEAQASVQAALAETLVGVIAQRLLHRADLGVRLPECEVLVNNDPVRAIIRQGAFGRLQNQLQTGAAEGMWSFERWRRWQDSRDRHFVRSRDAGREPLPDEASASAGLLPPIASERVIEAPAHPSARPGLRPSPPPTPPAPRPRLAVPGPLGGPPTRTGARGGARPGDDGVLDLDGNDEDLASILKELS